MIFNSQAGYRLLKATVPVFLQLAYKRPYLWSQNSTISISHAVYALDYRLQKFVLWDTMAALAFASSPLMRYDTRLRMNPDPSVTTAYGAKVLEWVYGCPPMMIILIAKINACRVDKRIGQIGPGYEDWRELEKELKRWSPLVDYVGDSTGRVMRLAIQEGWRHAMLIYLYMAGVAARYESHRAILRQKLCISKNENIWCLRGADFVPVLDYLWHGAGADGCPTTWESYAVARCTVLSIE
ncbi:hypothetical protein FRC06_011490 [Ceratobasidium sp. 370]|nr:hypothetical protein FRC06_011490 [Ceratobasidium sp. 370]